jgi:hypothetical protein
MSTTTGIGIGTVYSSAARMDVHEMTRQLNSHLGPTLVAALAGASDKSQAIRWARPDGPDPRPEAVRRLQLAHRAWTHLAIGENEHIARAWFVGGNPFLNEDTPITAIREDRGTAVMSAVTALLEDRPAL